MTKVKDIRNKVNLANIGVNYNNNLYLAKITKYIDIVKH